MRARVTDPHGPFAVRIGGALGPLVPGVALCFMGLDWGITVALFGVFVATALPLRQRAPTNATIETGPGWIDVKKAGTRSQRIRARDITGATTARVDGHVLLTLAHRRRWQPIHLELDSEADASTVRTALGIGHGGFGKVGWYTRGGPSWQMAIAKSIVLACIVAVVAAASIGGASALVLLVIGVLLTFYIQGLAIAALIGMRNKPLGQADVELTAEGLLVQPARKVRRLLGYAEYRRALLGDGNLTLELEAPPGREDVPVGWRLLGGGLSPYEATALIRQLDAAAARARGHGAAKEEVELGLDSLKRNGAPVREWLARLDVTGGLLRSSASGYRGQSLDEGDLWKVLEDPDASSELRAAAARVLRHGHTPETRTRIDAAIAAERDDRRARRLRVALGEDVETAAREIDALDGLDTQVEFERAARAAMHTQRKW